MWVFMDYKVNITVEIRPAKPRSTIVIVINYKRLILNV